MIPARAVVEARTGLMLSPYTIWEDAPEKHFGNHFGCNLPRHNNKPVAKASPYFAERYNIACELPKGSQFPSPLLGFSNWRMVTKDEAEKMFFGREGLAASRIHITVICWSPSTDRKAIWSRCGSRRMMRFTFISRIGLTLLDGYWGRGNLFYGCPQIS